jgi:DNA-binding transcriptional LysR family regulator
MSPRERMVADSGTIGIHPADVAAFCRVVDLGSVTAAAREAGEGKGTVSRRIDRLEARLGVRLLQRSGRSVTATEAGLLYRERAGAALELLADAAAVVRDQQATPTGHLRVTAPLGLGALLLGPLVASFTTIFPRVTIELVLTDQVLSFDRDRIDVAFRLSAQLPDSSLVATKLFAPDGVLVAAPVYLDRVGRPAHPDDLEGHAMLLPPLRGTATPLAWRARADPSVVVERVVRGRVLSHDMALLREVAVAGAGVALAPRGLVGADLAEGRLAEVLPEWRLSGGVWVWLLTRGGALPPKVRAFRDHVVRAVAGRG